MQSPILALVPSVVTSQLPSLLLAPILVELGNVVAHYFLRPVADGLTGFDTASMLISAAVVFYSAWVVARRTSLKIVAAALAGVLVWVFSVLVVLGLTTLRPSAGGLALDVVQGYILSTALLVPLVIAIAAIGGIAGKKRARGSG